MSIPGLSLFYAGLVRSKNALSVLVHCFVLVATGSLIWAAVGYTLAFGPGGSPYLGGLGKAFLSGVTQASVWQTIPELLWFLFQGESCSRVSQGNDSQWTPGWASEQQLMISLTSLPMFFVCIHAGTFAIITPGLMVGAFVERLKFSSFLLFTSAWSVLVYAPVCHWVWGGGWMAAAGVLDFAGGIVVHITAGVGALTTAVMLGPRAENRMAPHSLPMAVTGAGMLWVGWYGFNGGSAVRESEECLPCNFCSSLIPILAHPPSSLTLPPARRSWRPTRPPRPPSWCPSCRRPSRRSFGWRWTRLSTSPPRSASSQERSPDSRRSLQPRAWWACPARC